MCAVHVGSTTFIGNPLVLIPRDILHSICFVIVRGKLILINDIGDLSVRKSARVLRASSGRSSAFEVATRFITRRIR